MRMVQLQTNAEMENKKCFLYVRLMVTIHENNDLIFNLTLMLCYQIVKKLKWPGKHDFPGLIYNTMDGF